MKATQRDFAGAAKRAAAQCSIFYFCGPDEAGAAAAAERIVGLLADPGERVEMAGSELRKDPARLGDEARSMSLFGSSRHIHVRAQGDDSLEAIRTLAESLDAGASAISPVLIVATSATDKARSAKLLEKRQDALVAVFWPPELNAVAASVREMADAAGLRLNGDLAERIARAARLDVRLARSEVDKLALYLDASATSPRSADIESLAAIGAVAEEDGFMPLVNAALSGEKAKITPELQRMRELGISPVGILLAIERRIAQLVQLCARSSGRSVRATIEAECKARRIFFRDKTDLERQLHCWRGPHLDRLVERSVALHRALFADSRAAETLLAQGLAEIAREAARHR